MKTLVFRKIEGKAYLLYYIVIVQDKMEKATLNMW